MFLWERWRRTRWAVIAACLLPLSGGLLYTLGDAAIINAVNGTKILFYLFFTILTGWLLVGQCESRNMDLEFPKRLFRFPIGTTILLAVYMGYGVVAVAVPTLIVFGFVKWFFEPISDAWTIFLVLETVYIVLQTLSWLGGPARFLCITLALAFVYTLLKVTAMFNLFIGIKILCLIIIFLCCGISFWSISKYRHGGWLNSWRWVDSFVGMFRKKPSKHFASPLHAQIWFELRQTGHLFPLTALCFISPILGYVIYNLAMGLPPSTPISNIIPSMFIVMSIAPLIAGFIVLAVYSRDYTSGALYFLLRRPMATRTLATARLHAMVRSLARVIVIIIVVSLVVLTRDWATGALDTMATYLPFKWNWISPVKWALKYSSPLEIATMTILGLYGTVLLFWTLYRLNLVLVVGVMIFALIYLMMTSLTGDVAATWIWNITIIVLTVTVLAAFYIARRRNLITTTTLVIIACMFPLAVITLWAYPWFHSASGLPKGLPDLNQFEIIRIIAAAILPFIPVVATPLLMDKLRHR